MLEFAHRIRRAGASILHGRIERRSEQRQATNGAQLELLDFFRDARDASRCPVAAEVLDARDVERADDAADLLHVGGRSMHDRSLLAAVASAGRPVILESGPEAALHDLLEAAEHVIASGNPQVVLCHRGDAALAGEARVAIDVPTVPLLKSLTHLPVISAPSEACVQAGHVAEFAFATVASGADGLMLDVHDDDAEIVAAPGSRPTLRTADFVEIVERLRPFAAAAGRCVHPPGVSARDAGLSGAAAGALATERLLPPALTALRSEIAQVDERIVELVARRVELARAAGEAKREAGLPVIDAGQEHEVLARVRALAASAGLPYTQLHALQAYLIDISRRAQTHPSQPPTAGH